MSQKRYSKRRIGPKRKRHAMNNDCAYESVDPFKAIATSFVSCHNDWYICNDDSTVNVKMMVFRIGFNKVAGSLYISRSLILYHDLSWKAFVHHCPVSPSLCLFSKIPSVLTVDAFRQLLNVLDSRNKCCGNADRRMVKLCQARKGLFMSVKKDVVSRLDTNTDGSLTVRHVLCELLVEKESSSGRCAACSRYRPRLRSIVNKSSFNSVTNKKTNDRYLRTPQRTQVLIRLRKTIKGKRSENLRLKKKLRESINSDGISTDDLLQQDLEGFIEKHQNEVQSNQSDFCKIFWQQQIAAMKVNGKQGMRWHPLFLRWCISIMLSSPKTYNIIRNSNIITLPSQRTLKDYTHWFKPKCGFQKEAFIQLFEDFKVIEMNEAQRQVVLSFDEMKIKEGLTFDSETGNLIGYVDTGDMNEKLRSYKGELLGTDSCKEVATHILGVCVRGIFTKLEYPLGQFATTSISGQDLYDIVWDAIRRLRSIGLYVTVIVCDGVSNNRNFFKLHRSEDCVKDGVTYRVRNIYDPSR